MSIEVTELSPRPIVTPASTPSSSGSGPGTWAAAAEALSAIQTREAASVFLMVGWSSWGTNGFFRKPPFVVSVPAGAGSPSIGPTVRLVPCRKLLGYPIPDTRHRASGIGPSSIQSSVDTFLPDKLAVLPLFNDPPPIQHDNAVGAKDSAQTVSDDQGGPPLEQLLHRLFYESLTLAVETRGRLVENHYRGIL